MMNVFVCSNKDCRAVWDADPHGHCPACDRTANYPAPGSVGFSTTEYEVRSATRLQAKAPDALEQIAEFLVEQRGEPWPGGTDATRLHYWRDKAIEGARRLRALQAPETDYSGIDDGI